MDAVEGLAEFVQAVAQRPLEVRDARADGDLPLLQRAHERDDFGGGHGPQLQRRARFGEGRRCRPRGEARGHVRAEADLGAQSVQRARRLVVLLRDVPVDLQVELVPVLLRVREPRVRVLRRELPAEDDDAGHDSGEGEDRLRLEPLSQLVAEDEDVDGGERDDERRHHRDSRDDAGASLLRHRLGSIPRAQVAPRGILGRWSRPFLRLTSRSVPP